MKKGVNALEVVFGMFLLIVVVFIVIKLITQFVTPEKISKQLNDFNEANQAAGEIRTCKDLCESYNTNDCNLRDAAKYCLQKVNIDITGNKIPGEKSVGNFITGEPYCEDGLYCFHINDCFCGSYKLDATTCLQVLCDFYVDNQGHNPKEAIKLITGNNGINWGTCNPDPTKWGKLGFKPSADLRADWWYQNAGYYSLKCTNIQPGLSGINFDNCKYSAGSVICDTTCTEIDAAFFIYRGEYIDATTTFSNGQATIASKSGLLASKCLSQPNPFTIIFFCKTPSGYGTAEMECSSAAPAG